MDGEGVFECFIKGGEKSWCLRHRKGYTIVKYVLKCCVCHRKLLTSGFPVLSLVKLGYNGLRILRIIKKYS